MKRILTAGVVALGIFIGAPRVVDAQVGYFGQNKVQYRTFKFQTMKTAEASSLQGIQGKLSSQKVVEAVLAAEQTLQSAIAIRDKAVASYLELTRMQI